MSMSPKVKKIQPKSQATPLANDVLNMMRGQIQGGTAGAGLGPLQREAGTGIRQYVNSGGGSFDTSELFSNLEKGHARRVNQGALDIREAFAGMGNRFSDTLAREEGNFRSNAEADFGAQLGEISRQEYGNQQQRLLAAINMMQAFGNENMAPIFNMAGQGILPEDVVVGDSPFQQITGAVTGVAGLALGAGFNPFKGGPKPMLGDGMSLPHATNPGWQPSGIVRPPRTTSINIRDPFQIR